MTVRERFRQRRHQVVGTFQGTHEGLLKPDAPKPGAKLNPSQETEVPIRHPPIQVFNVPLGDRATLLLWANSSRRSSASLASSSLGVL